MSCQGGNCSSTEYDPSDTSYQVHSGKFGLCSAVWDEESRTLRAATESDVMKCCLQTAKPWTEMCLDRCEKLFGPQTNNTFQDYINCRYNCGRMILATENACALSNPKIWRGNSPIIPCVSQYGCGKYPNYDKECIKRNKDGLIRCCNKTCWPSSTMSCTQHCTLKYFDLAGETKDPLIAAFDQSKEIETSAFDQNLPGTGDNSWVWYLISLGVAIVFVGVFIAFRR